MSFTFTQERQREQRRHVSHQQTHLLVLLRLIHLLKHEFIFGFDDERSIDLTSSSATTSNTTATATCIAIRSSTLLLQQQRIKNKERIITSSSLAYSATLVFVGTLFAESVSRLFELAFQSQNLDLLVKLFRHQKPNQVSSVLFRNLQIFDT